MHISILLMEQIIELFIMILMGFIIVKAGIVKDEDSKVLSKIVLYLIIPCVIINAFQVDYTSKTVRGLLIAFAASVILQLVLLFIISAMGRLFHMNEVEVASVYYSNSGNLFAGMDLKKVFANRRVYFVTFLRMLLVPLISLILIKISHMAYLSADAPKIMLIVFLAVITPSASTVTQMCQVYGNDSRYASAINVVTTLCAVVTMPVMVLLYEEFI